MAITSCTEEIYKAFYSEEIAKGFFHGHTYTANPLSCTAALAGIELLTSPEIQEGIRMIASEHLDFKKRMQAHPKVRDARCWGVVFAMELNVNFSRYGNMRDRLFSHFMDCGIFLRPLGNTIYILPPYVISKEELHQIYRAIEAVFDWL